MPRPRSSDLTGRRWGSPWRPSIPDPRASVDPRLIRLGQQIILAFQEFKPVELILFGSRAYGQPQPTSDADFLLISSRRPSPNDVTFLAGPIANNSPIHLQIHPRTPGEVLAELGAGKPWLVDAITKGIVLHPASSHGSTFARALRRAEG